MLRLLAKPWELIKALFVLAFPMVRGAPRGVGGGTAGTWVARGILLLAALTGLTWLNRWERIGLRNVIPYGRIGEYWLPLFALCLYAMIWTGWWIYRLLSLDVPPVASEYPDIDRAWGQAVEALARADILILDTPLFLILGSSGDGEEALFQAAGIKDRLKQGPRDPADPLRVTANNEAIWVSCVGASVLGQMGPADGTGFDGPGDVGLDSLADEPAGPFQSVAGGGGETLRIEDFMASLKQAQAERRGPGPARPRRSVDSEKYAARLRYLCRLIARDRQGLCPINGVLVVLPVTAAAPGSSFAEVATACKTDLTEAFDVLRMRCPVLFLLSDLDKIPGFEELVERLPAEQRTKRMGQRFPLVPDLDPARVGPRIEESVAWIGTALFPSMVHSRLQTERAGGEDVTELVRANSRLFRFLAAMRDRRERLAQLVRDCIPALPGEPILYRGCYIAGTGPAATEQAFAAGVLKLLIREQDNVTWTAEAVAQDEDAARWARMLKVFLIGVIALGIVAILTLIGWKLFFTGPDEAEG